MRDETLDSHLEIVRSRISQTVQQEALLLFTTSLVSTFPSVSWTISLAILAHVRQ